MCFGKSALETLKDLKDSDIFCSVAPSNFVLIFVPFDAFNDQRENIIE